MPRKLRVEYEGAIYHVMNRGDRREAIFLSDQDRELFVQTLGQTCGKTGWQVHAFCLMNNPFYLVLETPRANLVAGMRCWSSWPEYLKRPGQRPPWLRVDRVPGEASIKEDNAAGRRQLEQTMEQRKELETSKESGDWKRLRRGWCWGPNEFREELLELIGQKHGKQHYGEELRESDEQKALRLVAEMLRQEGWTGKELKALPKWDRKKVRMAERLREVHD